MKILGISDEVTTCECCGKNGLKKTVVLGTETGTVHYGSDCAALAMRGSKKPGQVKVVNVIARAADMARKWLDQGHTPQMVKQVVWNKFGFQSTITATALEFDDFTVALNGV